ncbi:hypothetical protein KAR91_51855 [Candidatus Pacearchaeota archaeon]|nr:hypothetical protein [Candidatus Pacearchaeota archaeon]
MVKLDKMDPETKAGLSGEVVDVANSGLAEGEDLGMSEPQKEKLKGLKTVLLMDLVDDRLFRVLGGMTQEKIDAASLSVLNATFKNFSEKRQLLRGMPTEIVDESDRKLLKDIFPKAMNELRRRGLVEKNEPIDITPEAEKPLKHTFVPLPEKKERDDEDSS